MYFLILLTVKKDEIGVKFSLENMLKTAVIDLKTSALSHLNFTGNINVQNGNFKKYLQKTKMSVPTPQEETHKNLNNL